MRHHSTISGSRKIAPYNMRAKNDPYLILRLSRHFAEKNFPKFGVNKKQEAVRLIFEIAKRDGLRPKDILPAGYITQDFNRIKSYLTRKRFPEACEGAEKIHSYLPSIALNKIYEFKRDSVDFYPKTVLYESAVAGSHILRKCSEFYPKAGQIEISSLKSHVKGAGIFTIKDYNERRKALFIIKERFDFLKPCPCTKNAVPCEYRIFNSGFGCIYDCTYCFLQEYINSPGIVLAANLDDFFDSLPRFGGRPARIGSGEFSDSLMLDDLTGHSLEIIGYLRKRPEIIFEFKTKSANISNVLKAAHAGNIVISWSMNPERLIKENEFYTATLEERLDAARSCRDAGYKIGIHLDPIFHYRGWERDYEDLIGRIFDSIRPHDIAWLSLGTLRFRPKAKKTIEARFPRNKILDEELLPGRDGKLRYPYHIRSYMYDRMVKAISKRGKNIPVYLCMETKRMWSEIGLKSPFGGM